MENYGLAHICPILLKVLTFFRFAFKQRFGEDNFEESLKISSKADLSRVDWTKFRYMVFDIPNHKGTYEERSTALGECLRTFKNIFTHDKINRKILFRESRVPACTDSTQGGMPRGAAYGNLLPRNY